LLWRLHAAPHLGHEVKHLSAVIVNFRTPDATAAAVRSVQASSRPAQDIIVVENGSGDDSFERLQGAVPGCVLLASRENGGFAAGVNQGLREALARGAELVLLLNSDATLERDALGSLERALDTCPDAGIAGPLVMRAGPVPTIDSAGVIVRPEWGRVLLRHHGERAAGQVIGGAVAAIAGCAMLVRHDVFTAIGGLTEDYFFGFEDLDFCFRAAAAGHRTIVAADAIVWHEGHASIGRGSPRLFYFAARNHLRFLQRHAARPMFHTTVRGGIVLLFNIAYVLSSRTSGRLAGLRAVVRGAWSHWRDRG
jgi:N-acetylglucosaminyl-diphospho-decaprenol L-rhamnosyltransferase